MEGWAILMFVLPLIVVFGILSIDGKLKRKLANDERIIQRLDSILAELKDLNRRDEY